MEKAESDAPRQGADDEAASLRDSTSLLGTAPEGGLPFSKDEGVQRAAPREAETESILLSAPAHPAATVVDDSPPSSGGTSLGEKRRELFKAHGPSWRSRRVELAALCRSGRRFQLLEELRREAETRLEAQGRLFFEACSRASLVESEDAADTHGAVSPKGEEGRRRPCAVGGSGRGGKSVSSRRTSTGPLMLERRFWGHLEGLFSHPRYVFEPPEELREGEYLVTLRPEGQRMVLIVNDGVGCLYDKRGRVRYHVSCGGEASGEGRGDSIEAARRRALNFQLQSLDAAAPADDQANLSAPAVRGVAVEAASLFQLNKFVRETSGSRRRPACSSEAPSSSSYYPNFPPTLQLPLGPLSRGLSVLECVLCPYTAENIHFFGAEKGAQGAPFGKRDDGLADLVEVDGEEAASSQTEGPPSRSYAGEAYGNERVVFEVLFVLDVFYLSDLMLGHCEFECRHFMLKSRFEEDPASFCPLQLLPFEEASAASLRRLSESRFPLDDFNAGKEVLEAYLILSPEGELLSYEGLVMARLEEPASSSDADKILRVWLSGYDFQAREFTQVRKVFRAPNGELKGHRWKSPSLGSKLIDQWLRMAGKFTVDLECLCKCCPS